MRREASKYFHFTDFGRRAHRNLIYLHEASTRRHVAA